MAWCGCSRKGRQSLASSGGGGAGWSVCTSTPYILWRRRSSKALRPFSGDVYGWVFCAKNWQLNRKLTEVVSDITGKTGMTILRAILAGDRAPQRLAPSRDKRCKHDHATIAKALEGHWRAEPLFALQQAVDQYDFLAQQLRACDGHIEGGLQAFVPHVEAGAPQAMPARPWRASRSHPLGFEVPA